MSDEKKLIVDYFVALRLANVEHHVDSLDQIMRDGGNQGPQGATGATGPPGPRPAHRWLGTSLQWEMPNGEWSVGVDLQGPPGRGGGGGAPGAQGPQGFQGANGTGTGSTA